MIGRMPSAPRAGRGRDGLRRESLQKIFLDFVAGGVAPQVVSDSIRSPRSHSPRVPSAEKGTRALETRNPMSRPLTALNIEPGCTNINPNESGGSGRRIDTYYELMQQQ